MFNLTGLATSSPISFMAALGMLRVLVQDRGHRDLRLGWKAGHAVIQGMAPEVIISELMQNMTGRADATEFTWADSPKKATVKDYRTACQTQDPRTLGFMAGWATDTFENNGLVTTTRLDMTSGPQKLLKELRMLAGKINAKHIEVALLGGSYENQSSYGLDPLAVRKHAYEPQAPAKSKAPGKPGMVWLAFESIPLHPIYPVVGQRPQTTGWQRHKERTDYCWPIWDGLLTYDEVVYLRWIPVEHMSQRSDIRELWRSQYGQAGQYGMLLPAFRER